MRKVARMVARQGMVLSRGPLSCDNIVFGHRLPSVVSAWAGLRQCLASTCVVSTDYVLFGNLLLTLLHIVKAVSFRSSASSPCTLNQSSCPIPSTPDDHMDYCNTQISCVHELGGSTCNALTNIRLYSRLARDFLDYCEMYKGLLIISTSGR